MSVEEGIKRRLHPLAAFPRLLECAATNCPPDEEDQFRFQWFGLFYQAPAQDAFVLRLRLPGGRLRPFQLAGLAEITQEFAGGQIILNDRGGLDVPGVPVTLAAKILSAVEAIGLSARCAGGDCVQAVRGGEYERPGPGTEDQASIYPLVCALERALAFDPAFADLPGLCEIVFRAADETDRIHDPTADMLTLRSVSREEGLSSTGEDTFLLVLPGATDGGFRLSTRAVVPGCLSLLSLWRSDADRSNRQNAGLARFLRGVDPEALRTALGGAERVPLPRIHPGRRDPVPGCPIPGARLLSGQLAALEGRCREQGWREIRLAHGHVHIPETDSGWVENARALARVWSV